MTSTVSPTDHLQSVNATALKCGTRLRFPIYDENNILLLAKGQVIERSFLGRLANRGISQVKVHQAELTRILAGKPQGQAKIVPDAHPGSVCQETNSVTNCLDQLLGQDENLAMPQQGEAFSQQIRKPGVTQYDTCLESEVVDNHVKSVADVDSLFESISRSREMDVGALSEVSESTLDYVREDPDLFTCLGVNPLSETYPARHSVHTQMLAVAIGINMGLDRKTLKELAVGCLIHDSGMLQIDQGLYNRTKPLTQSEFLEITKHPIRTFDTTMNNQVVPHRSAFIAYQMHERCNGTGYPRGRKGNQIHFLAKIAGVADAFTALVTPRPHREGMLPYKAMESMIRGVKSGLFDSDSVRALLSTTSLFPLGSYVELSDGRIARTIRANGQNYSNPIVEAWKAEQSKNSGQIVDLSQEPTLHIKRPLPDLPF